MFSWTMTRFSVLFMKSYFNIYKLPSFYMGHTVYTNMFLRYFNYMVNQCEMRKEITMRVAFWTSSFLHRAKRMLNIAPKHHKKIMMDRVIPETRVSSCTWYWVWEAHFSATIPCHLKMGLSKLRSGTLNLGFSYPMGYSKPELWVTWSKPNFGYLIHH